MINVLHWTGFLCAVCLLVGCGESRTNMNSRTYYGAFNNIVAEVQNAHDTVNNEQWDVRLQPVEDQFGSAVAAFMRNEDVKGTPLEAEAQKLLDHEAKIMEIWQSSDGSVEKVKAAVQEMMDHVEHMKTMIE
jgi:hypothetical protein